MRRKCKKTVLDQERHFKKRAGERYGEFGIDPSVISKLIQSGDAIFVWKESNTRTHHLIDWNGKPMKVVYDKLRNTVVTALPQDC